MRFHLRILYGADDRYQIARQTLDVCKDYFHTIRVVNSGPPELKDKFKDLPPNTTVETLHFFFGDLESARNAMLYDVDVGDYVLWLDADERPSQLMLDNLEFIASEVERRQVWGVRFPGCNHEWNTDGTPRHGMWDFDNRDAFPKHAEEYGEKMTLANQGKGPFPLGTIGRMLKKLHPLAGANTNFGGHGNLINYKNNFDMFVTRFPIIHLKHDIMIFQSAATCTYVNPCLNAPIKDGYKPYANSVEFKKLREFQIRTGAKTQNDLCRKLHLYPDPQFKAELKELLLCEEFRNSQLYDNFFKHYHVWAGKYDCSWKTPPIYCGNNCCRYKNIQL